MFKTNTASDFRKYFNLVDDYHVDGFLAYGSCKQIPYQQLEDALKRVGLNYEISRMENEVINDIAEIKIDGKIFWFAVVHAGALLSEFLHVACLFGSKKNLLLGSCGGLSPNANSREIIIPEYSFATESSARGYKTDIDGNFYSDKNLSNNLINNLSQKYKVHFGPMMTNQAVQAQTWDDITAWSEQGYLGVEMEAATVFAVSDYFKIPSAAIIYIAENLIQQESTLDDKFINEREQRMQVAHDMFDTAVKELLS